MNCFFYFLFCTLLLSQFANSKKQCKKGKIIHEGIPTKCDECELDNKEDSFGCLMFECSKSSTGCKLDIYRYNVTNDGLIHNANGLTYYDWSLQNSGIIHTKLIYDKHCVINHDHGNEYIKLSSDGLILAKINNDIINADKVSHYRLKDGCYMYTITCNNNVLDKERICYNKYTKLEKRVKDCKSGVFVYYLPEGASDFFCNHKTLLIILTIAGMVLLYTGLLRVCKTIMDLVISVTITILIKYFRKWLPKCRSCGMVSHTEECETFCYCGEQIGNSSSLKDHVKTCNRSYVSVIYKIKKRNNLVTSFLKYLFSLLIIFLLVEEIASERHVDLADLPKYHITNEEFPLETHVAVKTTNPNLFILLAMALVTFFSSIILIKNILFLYMVEINLIDIIPFNLHTGMFYMKCPYITCTKCKKCTLYHERYDPCGVCNCGSEFEVKHKLTSDCLRMTKHSNKIVTFNAIEIILLVIMIILPMIAVVNTSPTCFLDLSDNNATTSEKAIISIYKELYKLYECEDITDTTSIPSSLCESIRNFHNSSCNSSSTFLIYPFSKCNIDDDLKAVNLVPQSLYNINKCINKDNGTKLAKHVNTTTISLKSFQSEKDLINTEVFLDGYTKSNIIDHIRTSPANSKTFKTDISKDGHVISVIHLSVLMQKYATTKVSIVNNENFPGVSHDIGVFVKDIKVAKFYEKIYSTGPVTSTRVNNYEQCNGACPKFDATDGFATFKKGNTSHITCETIGCFSYDDGCVWGECRDNIDDTFTVMRSIERESVVIVHMCILNGNNLKCYIVKSGKDEVDDGVQIEFGNYNNDFPRLLGHDGEHFLVGDINDLNSHKTVCGTPQVVGNRTGFLAEVSFDIDCHFFSGKSVNINKCFKNTFELCTGLDIVTDFDITPVMKKKTQLYEAHSSIVSSNNMKIIIETENFNIPYIDTKSHQDIKLKSPVLSCYINAKSNHYCTFKVNSNIHTVVDYSINCDIEFGRFSLSKGDNVLFFNPGCSDQDIVMSVSGMDVKAKLKVEKTNVVDMRSDYKSVSSSDINSNCLKNLDCNNFKDLKKAFINGVPGFSVLFSKVRGYFTYMKIVISFIICLVLLMVAYTIIHFMGGLIDGIRQIYGANPKRKRRSKLVLDHFKVT